MTISSTTRKTALLPGNGATTSFPFTFKAQAAGDIVVYKIVSDVESVVDDSLYTVSLNADQNVIPGGSVVFGAAPATGTSVVVTTEADSTQEQSIQNQGDFNPTVVMEALDKLTILVQQLEAKVARGLQTPITSPGGATVGTAAERASTYLGFDASGNLTTLTALLDGITVAGSWTTSLATALGANWQGAFATALGANWSTALAVSLGNNWSTAFDANLGTNWTTALGANLGAGWSARLAEAQAVTGIGLEYNGVATTFNRSSATTHTNVGVKWQIDGVLFATLSVTNAGVVTLTGTDFELESTKRIILQTQSTVGTSGSASALPGTPEGYAKIKIGSTERVIPYYKAS